MNRKKGKWVFPRVSSCLLALALVVTSFFSGGAAPVKAYQSTDADTAMKAFNQKFWDPQAKYFWENTNQGDAYQSFWIEAELWELVMDAYLNTSDPVLKTELRAQIDDVFNGAVAKYGSDWLDNPFNDDIMWWAMGSARAYEITNDSKYLDKAKYYFDFVYDTQRDDEFGGGIWWLNSEHVTKNACVNFPAAQAAVFLYNITGNSHYLDAATDIYRWGKTILSDGNGKIFDRIEPVAGPIPHATHYNQGTFIGAAVGLYEITGDVVYLDDAIKAAQFVKEHQVDDNGILNYEGPNVDLKGGKTILLRNFAYLLTALEGSGISAAHLQFGEELSDWLAFNTEMAWSHRNADGLVDGNWIGQKVSGTYDSWTASNVVQALTVFAPAQASLNYVSRDAYEKIEVRTYNIGKGFVLEGSPEGSLQLGGVQDGHYAAYKNVDFGNDEASGVIARASSGTGGGTIEVRLDGLTGPVVGTIQVEGTGGWSNFMDAAALLKDESGDPVQVTGVHDVYFLFKKTQDDYLFNLNWFKFTKNDPTRSNAYTKLQAENLDDGVGLSINGSGTYVDHVMNGAYALYRDMDFGSGAAGVTLFAASGHQGGTVEIRLDSLTGPVISKIPVPALDDWNSWVSLMGIVDDQSAVGVHDVYFVFKGKDGNDFPCNLDWFNFTMVKGREWEASGKIEAEDYTNAASLGKETGGGQTYLAGLYGPNNPYAMYNYVDFGATSPQKLYIQAASDASGGVVEVRIDSMQGPVIANVPVTGTSGWQNFQVFSTDLETQVTGEHVVFFLFKGSDWLFNVDKYTFGDPAVFTMPEPEPEPVTDTVPPGEVENVRAVLDGNQVRLYWDGPYDLDGSKVLISLYLCNQQAGATLEVERGVQTVLLPGVSGHEGYTITIQSVDHSGNNSSGYSFLLEDKLNL
ncbi:carbohydrate-binding protein [Paenibacillus antibioticophila]|uniref:carbohydrate-binding protein n=1 Tax=Paenibacillus antibioticophila TaxID=1274374 RepID=UPI0005C94C10|nr:carbohydrate-binding protein [Paenibacillus antibioticophila]